jgi:hypothetical protein
MTEFKPSNKYDSVLNTNSPARRPRKAVKV